MWLGKSFLLCALLLLGGHQAYALDVDDWLKRPGVKMLAVEFYASWCKPCIDAVPRWKKLHEKYRKDGLRLVVVATQDTAGICVNPGWSPDEIVCDDEGLLAQRFGVESLPSAFLWTWQGQNLGHHIHIDEVEAKLEKSISENPRVDVRISQISRHVGISEAELLALTRAELQKLDKLTVIATKEERKKLREIQRASLAANADAKLACEIGAEISANSLLDVDIVGTKPRLQLKLLSVERGCLVAAATTQWNIDKPGGSVQEATAKLISALRVKNLSIPQVKTASRKVRIENYKALLDKVRKSEKQQRRELFKKQQQVRRTWFIVLELLNSSVISIEEKISIVEKFILDFPQKSPYREKAQIYKEKLLAENGETLVSNMIRIPEGEFWMGCSDKDSLCKADERPRHRVYLSKYWIDKTEVIVSDYKKCVDRKKCTEPLAGNVCHWKKKAHENHPINCISWYQAKDYCLSLGKRLPTEAEWERAARQKASDIYPWGYAEPGVRAVRSEWTADCYDRLAYTKRGPDTSNPVTKCYFGDRVVRRGAFDLPSKGVALSARQSKSPEAQQANIGFRCVLD